jgi:hypothetical protein
MDYRDERDALQRRVGNLEQDLSEAQRELDTRRGEDQGERVARLDRRVTELRGALDAVERELSAIKGAPRARPPGSRNAFAIVGAALVLAAAGIGALFVTRREPSPPIVDTPSVVTRKATPATPAAPGTTQAVDYFADATSVPAKLAAKVGGPVRVVELTVYPGYVISEIQDPQNHENVDRYMLRDGVVGDGEPVRLMGRMKTAKDVDDAVTDLATVDLAVLPAMVKEATARVGIDDAKVSHVMLTRNRPSSDVGFRVYVSGARKSGSAEFDAAGHLKKVWN